MELQNLSNNLQQAVDRRVANYVPTDFTPESQEEEALEMQQPQQESTPEPSIGEKHTQHKDNKTAEVNLARQREKYEADRKQMLDEINRLKQEVKANKPAMADEDLVEGRHWKSLQSRQEELEQRIAQQEATITYNNQMTTLRSKYTDFDSVVNEKTLEKLKATDPDAYDAINNARDLKAGGAAAYRILKSLQEPADVEAQTNAQQLERNLQKPGVGRNPSALAKMDSFTSNYMTDEDKKNHWETVCRYSRGG